MSQTVYATVIATAAACARESRKQGLTPEHLTPGWALAQGDVEALEEAVGRPLTPTEWQVARNAFEQEARSEPEPTPAPEPQKLMAHEFASKAEALAAGYLLAGREYIIYPGLACIPKNPGLGRQGDWLLAEVEGRRTVRVLGEAVAVYLAPQGAQGPVTVTMMFPPGMVPEPTPAPEPPAVDRAIESDGDNEEDNEDATTNGDRRCIRCGGHLGVQRPGSVHPECDPESANVMEEEEPESWESRVRAARSLEELLALIRADDADGDAFDSWMDLPTFGGEEPEDINDQGIWSWDENRVLVGMCDQDMKIEPRPAPEHPAVEPEDTREDLLRLGVGTAVADDVLAQGLGVGDVELLAESGEGDARLAVYRVVDVRVITTNGDPVWEEADPEGFGELLRQIDPALTVPEPEWPITTTLGAIRRLHPTWLDAGQISDVDGWTDDLDVAIGADGSVYLPDEGDEISPPSLEFRGWAEGERVYLAPSTGPATSAGAGIAWTISRSSRGPIPRGLRGTTARPVPKSEASPRPKSPTMTKKSPKSQMTEHPGLSSTATE